MNPFRKLCFLIKNKKILTNQNSNYLIERKERFNGNVNLFLKNNRIC